MLVEIFLVIGIGAVAGTTAAYVTTKHKHERIHFYDQTKLDDALEMFNIQFEKNVKCAICGTQITQDNVGLVRKKGDKVFETCSEHDMVPSDEVEYALT